MEDLIEDVGIAALNHLESKAMDIRRMKWDYGHRIALIGNVDVDLLSRGTLEMVIAETKQLLHDVAPGGGFLLGSSNSVTYYESIYNLAIPLVRHITTGLSSMGENLKEVY